MASPRESSNFLDIAAQSCKHTICAGVCPVSLTEMESCVLGACALCFGVIRLPAQC